MSWYAPRPPRALLTMFDRRASAIGTARLKPDVVVHLAGQSRVGPSLADPLADAQANVVGTINVISAAMRCGARRVVFASSGGTIYGEGRAGHRASESQPRRPLSPYGLGKATADAYLAMLAGDVGVSLALGNVYGPGGSGVCAEFLTALGRGELPRIAGDGTQTRDFVYVTDVCEAIMRSCVSPHVGTFNIGTGRATSVNALLATMLSVLGLTTDPMFTPWREGEVRHSCLDIGQARSLLGWEPAVDLAEGIRRTVAAERVLAGGRWPA